MIRRKMMYSGVEYVSEPESSTASCKGCAFHVGHEHGRGYLDACALEPLNASPNPHSGTGVNCVGVIWLGPRPVNSVNMVEQFTESDALQLRELLAKKEKYEEQREMALIKFVDDYANDDLRLVDYLKENADAGIAALEPFRTRTT